MRGGSLTRYHTPVVTTQEGKGLAEELIKLAGPLIVQQAQAGLQDIQRGQSLADTWAHRGEQLTRGLNRKAPALAWTVGKHKGNAPPKRPIKEPLNAYGISLVCEKQHGTHWRVSQNAKSHSTATRPRAVHIAVSSRGHDFWQVHHGALSLDARVLPPVGALEADPFETTPPPKDKRGHDFWQVHTHANASSLDVPACVPGEPRPLVDGDGPTPTRYKKNTPLNVVDSQHHVAQFV